MNKLLTLPRHPGDMLRLLVGTAILLFCTVTVREHHVGVLETDLFRLANDLPTALYPAFWVVMQAGNVVAVGVAAVAVAATRRFWLAANLAITGIGVWLVAKWIKQEVGRGRPADLLPDVTIRGNPDSGLGFVSGHAAVAVAIATLIAPYLGRRARWVAFAVAGLVCVSRMYVGVHLPLDVVGGAALGWAA
ncbi:MAG TPA: phosphatase PAP2 family protein, partial [Actinomycetota bacterium]|nr:phosphatase PAP2 family protein [Actinomycetota bacterium]